MGRAVTIEKAFKELHEGIYKWGEEKLQIAIETGYVESAGGFKLYLPNYSNFLELQDYYNSLDKEFWESYKAGKELHNKYNLLLEKKNRTDEDKLKLADISLNLNYTLYKRNAPKISKYAKIKSEYFKLCLNNPAQSMAAFQTKSALIALFKTIVERGDLWKARISNSPYDEILMEVKEELTEEYKNILAKCMIEEGNKWLKSNLFTMEAEAISGDSWYQCH
jgi:DNA polymerase I-like protein with 3'-5' exonuclease and polymerase domains